MKLSLLLTFNFIAIYNINASELIDLANSNSFINDQFIHQVVQQDMKSGNLSNQTLQLIKENKVLVDKLEMAAKSEKVFGPCYETDPKKKKKRTKKNHGWVIISSTEVSQNVRKPQYKELSRALPDSDYDKFYNELKNASSASELQKLVKAQSKGMNEEEYFSYLSEMTGRLPYSDLKASFDQGEQGVDDFFSLVTEDREALAKAGNIEDWGGICGDIHFATVLMGEAARPDKYEYFTASYAYPGGQHVYAFAVSKDDPNKAFVVNYGQVTKVDDITGVDSTLPRDDSVEGYENIGANVRIFKNSSESDSGQAEHVATLPTALGRFIEQAHTRDHQRASIPQTNAGLTTHIDFRNESTITKTKGDKIKTIEVAQGVKLLQGTLQNEDQAPTDVFSIAVYKERTKNTDERGNIINPKKIGHESNTSLSTSLVSTDQSVGENKFMFIRFNYYKGIHKSLISSDKVRIQANTGVNLNVDLASKDRMTTGDGNIQPYLGLSSKIKTSQSSNVSADIKATGAIGLKEERSVFQTSTLTNNVKMTTNVIEARARYEQKIKNNTLSTGMGLVSTQVGGAYNVFSSYQISTTKSGADHFISIDYTKPVGGFNKDISSNLLPVNEQASLMYGVKRGRVNAGGTLSYDIKRTNFFVGGKLKINILNNRSRSPAVKP